MPKLLWMFCAPFFVSLLTLCLSWVSEKNLKRFACIASLIPLGFLVTDSNALYGSAVRYDWLSSLSIQFYLQVDGLSYLFIALVSVIVPISVFVARPDDHKNVFYSLILFLQGLLIGFFTAQDLALFTFLWEAMLLPLYFLLCGWGGKERQKAAYTFILYMIAGSILMIIAVLSLYFAQLDHSKISSFSISLLSQISSQLSYAPLLAAIFILAFAVKTPLFPFHAWLVDAYSQSSLSGTILLSAILSKAGIYAFFRIALTLFPEIIQGWSIPLTTCAIVGVLYGACAAYSQSDYKKLIAYSSLSHVNFILVGLFICNETSLTGVLIQVINHAVTITALFIVAEWLYERVGTYSMGEISGLTAVVPHLSWLTLFFVLASVGLPGLNNFIGELLILFGLLKQSFWLAAVLAISIILSVLYMLKWMQKIYFGPLMTSFKSVVDLQLKEVALAVPLVLLILAMGIYPKPVLEKLQNKPTQISMLSQSEKPA